MVFATKSGKTKRPLYIDQRRFVIHGEFRINASVTLSATPPGDFASLQGQLLIAMPQMEDPRFHQSVMMVLEHDANGAMGLIINRPLDDLTFGDLLQQIRTEQKTPEELADDEAVAVPVCFGGPVEIGRGFVLHSPDVMLPHTKRLHDTLALTTSLDMIDMIAKGRGPQKALLALGYAGWTAGQLEAELRDNAWLTASFQSGLVFDTASELIWDKAIQSVGVNLGNLSMTSGRA